MARGYLGKISAIVSANTGDYVRKLDDSARRTRAFAKTIQSDLDRASKQSTRAINDILTPLQRLERAIQNASSARLKFNGVDTAISNVKQLQAAVSRLEGTNIDVAVRASGLRTITELKQQLQQLQQDDVDLFVNLVGANGTVDDLRRIRETYQEIDGKTVSTDVRVKADVAQVDRLIELFGTLSKQRLDAVVRVVGERQVEQAARSMRQLASVANELATPLGRAAQQLGGMTNEIQVAFGPALQRAQRGVLNLQDDIERGANISEQRYAGVARAVDRVTAAVSRLTEAQSLANSGQTGQELAFRAPRVRDELSQSAALSQQASQLPAATLADDSIRQRVEDLARLRQEIARYQTSVEKRQVLGLDTTEASARLAAAIRQSAEVRGSLERVIRVSVDSERATRQVEELRVALASIRENVAFTVTGEVQNFDQARQEVSRLEGAIRELDVAQRAAFSGDLRRLGELVETGDVQELDAVRRLIDRINAAVDRQRGINLDTSEAEQAANQLAASIDRLRQNADFVITGRPQNLDQARSELERLLGTLDQLNETQRASLRNQINVVIEALGREDLDAALAALAALRRDSAAEVQISIDTSDAEQRIRRIDDAWDFAVRGVPTTLDQVDAEFQSLASRIGSLGIEDRLNLDPLIADFRNSAQAGDPLIAQFERLLALRRGLERIESRPNLNFGLDLDDPQRIFQVLQGSVVSLKGQLDTLPAGIRNQFIPAIEAAEANLRRLSTTGSNIFDRNAAAAQIDQLTRRVRQVSQVQAIPNFAEAFEGSALRGATGNLQAFQQIIARVGVTAGSEAAVQFDRMRAAVLRAANDGTLGTRAFAQELQRLTNEAAEALAATGRIGRGAAFREIQRGGDIARGGFNNLSLAAQQAAFAIDDFFSVQGDFTQRLRAVQNNVTQLAFILGGTRGLFIGLGVAIAAQATVAIINWINEGRTAEDQTKALNDALSRQKSLVEELAQAFKSLGDSIAERAFSRSTQEARAFRRELDDLVKKQREAREAAIVDAAPGIDQVRADQNRISRQLENEVNPGRRAALLSQLDEAREAERRLANRAIEQPVATGQDVRNLFNRIAGSFEASAAASRQRSFVLNGVPGLQGFFDREARVGALPQNIAEILRRTDFGNTRQATESQARALEDLRRTIAPISGSRFLGQETVGSQAARAVELIRELEAQLRQNKLGQELDDAAVRIFESGNRVASRIEQAQNSVAEAIEAGIPGARAVEQSLNGLGDQLRQAFTDLREAESIRDPTRRREAQDRIQERINTIQRRQRDEVAAADALRRETTLFPEQSIQNVISRIESGLSNLGAAGGDAQAELRRLQFERESIRQQRSASGDNPFAARRLDIADAGLIDAIRSLEREVAELDETFNGFEARERDRFLGDAERGRELSLTPAQRAGEQLQQGLNDILARFGEVAENGNGLIDFQAAREAQLRFAEDQNRAAAPAIFNLADSVQNAILQGPSRAALNASDISTQEGARELNRLLRGQDPARDNANLLELQRQSQILEENNRILQEKLVAA